jgi:hypothetical protein
MNKLMLMAAIVLCIAGNITAQNDAGPREKITFGLKGGINYSNVWDEQGQDFQADPKLGLAGGLFLGIPLGKMIGLQPEFLISQKGLKATGMLAGSPYSFRRTTTYIDIPLQLQFKPVDMFTIVLGPQYSYLLSERNEYTWGANSVAQEQEFSNDNIRKNVLGFVAGADLNFSHLVVSGRFGWDFQTNNGDGSSFTPRYKNRWLQCTIGYKI